MSGSGRRSCYRKSVVEDFLYSLPELTGANEVVARVVGSRGTNIFEIEIPINTLPTTTAVSDSNAACDADKTQNVTTETTTSLMRHELALMPSKFKKLIWMKRGDFIIVSNGDDAAAAAAMEREPVAGKKIMRGKETVDVVTAAEETSTAEVSAALAATTMTTDRSPNTVSKQPLNTSNVNITKSVGATPHSSHGSASHDHHHHPATSATSATKGKVQYLIDHVLTKEQIVHLYKIGKFPMDFAVTVSYLQQTTSSNNNINNHDQKIISRQGNQQKSGNISSDKGGYDDPMAGYGEDDESEGEYYDSEDEGDQAPKVDKMGNTIE